MFKSMCLAAGLAALAMTTAASAADNLPARSYNPVYTQPAPVANWSGFYVGGHAGYGWGSSNYDVVFAGFGTLANGSANASGAFGGIQAGYNWQNGKFVFGPEIQYTWSGVKASSNFFGVPVSYRTPWSAAALAKVGYLIDPQFLLYAGGGVTVGRFKTEVIGVEDWSQTKTGPTFIVGADYLLAKNWVVGTRYTYEHYGTLSHDFATVPGLSVDNRVNAHKIDLRVSYKF